MDVVAVKAASAHTVAACSGHMINSEQHTILIVIMFFLLAFGVVPCSALPLCPNSHRGLARCHYGNDAQGD
jgi:hypothetical protein